MEKLPNIQPGEILSEEFLKPLEISAYRLAKATGIPQTRVSQILKGRRRITADTAIRLSRFLAILLSFGWAFRMIMMYGRNSKQSRKSFLALSNILWLVSY